ncbi:MAG TPA: hypothetical protein VN808_06280 [Stellaceae bacterium]|nr:hypothetical protein [Stellaceae bacterium]
MTTEAVEAAPLKYRAFLSYSHRDSAAAKRLHGRIEGFRIDKDLVGRDTAMGPVPKQLRSVFHDRHDFAAGGTLGEQTVAARDIMAKLVAQYPDWNQWRKDLNEFDGDIAALDGADPAAAKP